MLRLPPSISAKYESASSSTSVHGRILALALALARGRTGRSCCHKALGPPWATAAWAALATLSMLYLTSLEGRSHELDGASIFTSLDRIFS